MKRRDADKRALVFALVCVLALRLLALASGESANAGIGDIGSYHRNQTIPTPTPEGGSGPGPTREPPGPESTPRPTQVPPQETATLTRTVTSAPSSTPMPTSGQPAATVSTIVPQTPGRTTDTPTPDESPIFQPSTSSPMLTVPSPAQSLMSLPESTAAEGLVPASATLLNPKPLRDTDVEPMAATPIPSSAAGIGAGLWSTSCLWVLLGVVLIGTGTGILIRRRLTA